MNWDALGAVGEVVGAIAVVVTLLYLASQVRVSRDATEQNTKATRAASAALSQDSLASINDLVATNPELSTLLCGAFSEGSLEQFAFEESFRVQIFFRANLQRFEAMYFRYEEGLLESPVWEIRLGWVASFIKTPPVSDWWSSERESSIFSEGFIASIENAPGFTMNKYTRKDS